MASGKVFLREVAKKLHDLGVSSKIADELVEWLRKRWGRAVVRLPVWRRGK